ncbi:MAG: hypothetical protein ACRDPM_15640 [Solirubrobacteraceae bacterium]
MTVPRVLCYAPYNRWALHGKWEMTILHALKLRGAEVEYVLCDGLFTDCDQFWEAVTPRPANACALCQADVTRLVADMGMDYHWLGRYLTIEETREAKRWAGSLAVNELLNAAYGTWRVGAWVRLSVQSHFRTNQLDVTDPRIERGVRSYLYSGLIACFALDRLLEVSAPDVLLLFNGRQSSTCVALELARARGVRVVTHERGPRAETLTLVENASCVSMEPFHRYWREWGEVPLTFDELQDAARIMGAREQGRDTGWRPFTTAPQPSTEVCARLGLQDGRPLWVLFTSSDDETAGSEQHRSAFASQQEWIEATVAYARRHPEIDLVIRVHPNTGSRRSTGANRAQLEEMRALALTLPANVQMVDPDDEMSSYSLMDLCAVGFVWVSTVGLELACKGKPVVSAAGNYLSETGFVQTIEDTATYEPMLDSLRTRPPGAIDVEVMRRALRFTYGMFFRIPVDFPLVAMPNPHEGTLRYDSLEALRPGRDAGVDRCVQVVLDDAPVCPPPTEAQRARTTADEDEALKRIDGSRFTVLAFADELIADASLLRAWAAAFDGRDDVTLLIQTHADQAPDLIDAVGRAGLDRDDGPDLVAGEIDADAMASVAAVLSAIARGALSAAPCYDADSLHELARTV